MPHFMCPGCGHGIALRALLWAVHELGIDKNKLAVVSGIGCSGRVGAYIDANTYHTTHGRPLAFATGLKLARPDLTVVVITGDGDCLAIGGNHLIHACRRNLDITCLMLNNEIYGMTGGQVSPTTSLDRITTTTPHGNAEPTFDACALAEARRRELRRPRGDAPGAGAEEPDQGGDRPRGLLVRRGDLGLHRDLRPQERPRRIAGNDPQPEGRHAPGGAGDADDEPFRPHRLRAGVLVERDRPEYGRVYRERAGRLRAERKR